MTGDVLDASALLALVHSERGSELVEGVLEGAAMSTVNWSEVCARAIALGASPQTLRVHMGALGLELVPFDEADAETAADLWARTRHVGLSLGDRACLALAHRLGRRAVTADRTWLEIDLDVEVVAIR